MRAQNSPCLLLKYRGIVIKSWWHSAQQRGWRKSGAISFLLSVRPDDKMVCNFDARMLLHQPSIIFISRQQRRSHLITWFLPQGKWKNWLARLKINATSIHTDWRLNLAYSSPICSSRSFKGEMKDEPAKHEWRASRGRWSLQPRLHQCLQMEVGLLGRAGGENQISLEKEGGREREEAGCGSS